MFKVLEEETFKFEFNIEDETNPAYYILFNKFGSGDLNITITNQTSLLEVKNQLLYQILILIEEYILIEKIYSKDV